MTYRVQAMELIRRFEGYSATTYLCPAGLPTIGYGHAVKLGEVFPVTGIDAVTAERLLLQDVTDVDAAIGRLLPVALDDGQRAALISFTFNLGAGALQRSTLRRKILHGEHDDVPHELRKWVWAGGRKLNGLVRRREAEATLYSLET